MSASDASKSLHSVATANAVVKLLLLDCPLGAANPAPLDAFAR
jgi:hypothetical protein